MIPIILINHNRLSSTENLCRHLLRLGYGNIHIADMGSTYPELLEWYNLVDQSNGDITVHRFDNLGHKGIWANGFLKSFSEYPWVVVSDSDIELHPDTPKGFIEQMILCVKDFRHDKCGLAITYKDISNPILNEIVYPIECKYWWNQLKHSKHKVYLANVDTTFCIVRPEIPFTYQAIRLADWPIKHLDWYMDFNNLTPEQQYYMDNANATISTTKQHYQQWLLKH